ncbi:MAG: Uma2 family endonuclease [Polyangiaceae bacterium]
MSSVQSVSFGDRMTLEEWAALDEDEPGEIVDGVLVEDEVPSTIHELVALHVGSLLRGWGRAHGALVFGSGVKLAVAPRRGRMPDVVAYFAGAPRPPPYGVVGVPPSLVVEIVSAHASDERRDRIDKLTEYAVFGIRWYWLVDPELRSFEILELTGSDTAGGARYAHAAAAIEGHLDPVPGCEGLSIDVGALWAEVDTLLREGASG